MRDIDCILEEDMIEDDELDVIIDDIDDELLDLLAEEIEESASVSKDIFNEPIY